MKFQNAYPHISKVDIVDLLKTFFILQILEDNLNLFNKIQSKSYVNRC